MKKIDNGEYRVKTAGLLHPDELLFSVGPLKCGNIKDGIGIYIHDFGEFVIPFDELMEMADAANTVRGYEKYS